MVRCTERGSELPYRDRRGKDPKGRGRHRIIVLGEYGKQGAGLSLEDAHEFQRKARRWFSLGLDPIDEKAKEESERDRARQERADRGTVAELVDEFVHRKLKAERWEVSQSRWVRDAKVKTKPRKRPEERRPFSWPTWSKRS